MVLGPQISYRSVRPASILLAKELLDDAPKFHSFRGCFALGQDFPQVACPGIPNSS